MRLTLTFLALLFSVGLSACDGSDAGDGDGNGTAPSAAASPGGSPSDPSTIGKIERFPGGTAVITSDHSLVSLACENGQLVLTTSVDVFTAQMPCDRMVTADIIDLFVGKPIVITIAQDRLRIENPEAGTLDLPATDGAPRGQE